tara:strand:- start:210 stop:350 length:141 start_codon:yes stop_codon:yes gene_type:complete
MPKHPAFTMKKKNTLEEIRAWQLANRSAAQKRRIAKIKKRKKKKKT